MVVPPGRRLAAWPEIELAPGVTIVLPHYGQPDDTVALIGQLRAQGPNRIIVVDDASPTPMPQVAGAEVIRRERNGGFGSAVNSGLREVRTECALVLNSDLTIPDEFVARLTELAQPWQPCVASPRLVSADGRSQWVARRWPTLGQQVVEWLSPLARWRDRRWWHRAVGHDLRAGSPQALAVDWLVGASILLPLREVRLVGGFDERYFMNCEEVDLQRRLRGVGVAAIYLGQLSVVHEGGGSSDSERSLSWLVSGRRQYAALWGGARASVGLQLGLTAATVVNAGVDSVRAVLGRKVTPLTTARQRFEMIWGPLVLGHAGPRTDSRSQGEGAR